MTSSTERGIGFVEFLGLTFIVLKLTRYIDWPWLWVLAPLWAPLMLVLFGYLCVFIFSLIDIWRRVRHE